LWNSGQNPGRDTMGNLAKLEGPVVANGRVYVPTFSNQLDVYGLLCGRDISSQVSVTAKPLSNQQTVTIRNTSGIGIDGPIQLALDDLSAGVSLANSSGSTGCAAPPEVRTSTWACKVLG
jgi:hypothetical protein